MSRHNHNRRWAPKCTACGAARFRLVLGECEACRSKDGMEKRAQTRRAKAARRASKRTPVPPLGAKAGS